MKKSTVRRIWKCHQRCSLSPSEVTVSASIHSNLIIKTSSTYTNTDASMINFLLIMQISLTELRLNKTFDRIDPDWHFSGSRMIQTLWEKLSRDWFSSCLLTDCTLTLDMYRNQLVTHKDGQFSVSKHTEISRDFLFNKCSFSGSIELHIWISYVHLKTFESRLVSVFNRINIKFQLRLESFWMNVRNTQTKFNRAWKAAFVE